MKENFLTIPDAPDYEINSKLVVRNKKTGHIMTPCRRKSYSKCGYYTLRSPVVPRGFISRTDVSLRRQAVAAVKNDTFEPIPSVDGKYEIDIKGNVRNAHTKKRLKPNCKDVYSMYDATGKKFVYAARNNLLWEVHGVYKKGWAVVAVRAEFQNRRYTFENCAECARFLLDKLPLALNTIQCYLWRRKPAIGDWHFTYVETQNPDITWDSRGLSSLARRQIKLASTS